MLNGNILRTINWSSKTNSCRVFILSPKHRYYSPMFNFVHTPVAFVWFYALYNFRNRPLKETVTIYINSISKPIFPVNMINCCASKAKLVAIYLVTRIFFFPEWAAHVHLQNHFSLTKTWEQINFNTFTKMKCRKIITYIAPQATFMTQCITHLRHCDMPYKAITLWMSK